VEQLRLRLKDGELEQYGEAFTPDFVYDVIKRLPRFVTMRVSSHLPTLSSPYANSP
jgi:ubiquitin carboxyl-terminal hydrolase 10